MKKRIGIVFAAALSLLLAGCQAEENGVVLGEYKGIELETVKQEVTDADVQAQLDYLVSMYPMYETVTDRDTVENGDTANINYEGKLDGVAFEGGTAENFDLTIGSGSFIEGFEEGLIGVKKGETVDLNLTFPEEYHSAELAGQEVVFTVTVNEIKTARTGFDEEYLEYLGVTDVESVEEYRDMVRKSMEEEFAAAYDYNVRMEVITKLMEVCSTGEPAEEKVEKYKQQNLEGIESEAAYYGVDKETFVADYLGMTMEELEEEAEAGAKETAKQVLVCLAIAEKEGIELTDAQVDEEIEVVYEGWGYASIEEFKENNDMELIRESILIGKVIDFLVENAVVAE